MKTKITETKFKSAVAVADRLISRIACLGAVILICTGAFAPGLFGQEQNNVSRLTAHSWVKPAPKQSEIAAMKNLIATKPGETLPLWTFSVQSSRDNNNYTGVMVGR